MYCIFKAKYCTYVVLVYIKQEGLGWFYMSYNLLKVTYVTFHHYLRYPFNQAFHSGTIHCFGCHLDIRRGG